MRKWLIFFLILLVVSGGYYVYTQVYKNQQIVEEDLNVTGVLKLDELGELECGEADLVDYYTYAESAWEHNNKFGIYIYAENKDFFELAQKLVNSNGGDWGYVLIPFNVKDNDKDKWERVFTQLRNKHLIPVIQLWDIDLDDYEDQTEESAQFLDSFVWPIKPRYITAYNEMNDSKFWYGKVDPTEYATILNYTIDVFKNQNPDFYIMNGALNISAPTDSIHMDALEYITKMNERVPGIFSKLDGWASHPYPQPNFSGSPLASGRWSIKAYEEELEHLKSLGVEKELPVFITETGWAHQEGESFNQTYWDIDKVSEDFKTAYTKVWLEDDRVRAVMPFTIRYDPPFDHFSWVNKDNVPYKHYDVVKSIKKVSGNPPRLEIKTINVCSQN